MPKVIHINSCVNWGSTGKIVEEINLAAGVQGYKTYTAYGRSMNPSHSTLIKIGNEWTRNRAILEARLLDNSGLACIRETKRLVDYIKKLSPDIIHLHNLHAYYLNYKLLFEYLNTTTIPIVWTLHDCWAFTGHCAHFVSVKCNKWTSECNHCPQIHSYPSSWFLDKSKRNFTIKKDLFSNNNNVHIVTVSKWMEKMARMSFLRDLDIRTIYNGIDTNTFNIGSINKHDKIRLLGVASTWNEQKGLLDFIRLREKISKDKYEIVLVGLSERQIKNLPHGIEGHTRTNSTEELVNYYRNSDIVLSLSYGESLGLTPIEGMACGTPAIVYNNTAQPELVSNETGEVVETGNIDELVEAVYRVSIKGKSSYSMSCRERAMMLFNKENNYKEYVRLYDTLLL